MAQSRYQVLLDWVREGEKTKAFYVKRIIEILNEQPDRQMSSDKIAAALGKFLTMTISTTLEMMASQEIIVLSKQQNSIYQVVTAGPKFDEYLNALKEEKE